MKQKAMCHIVAVLLAISMAALLVLFPVGGKSSAAAPAEAACVTAPAVE